jgi:hypothetical protein
MSPLTPFLRCQLTNAPLCTFQLQRHRQCEGPVQTLRSSATTKREFRCQLGHICNAAASRLTPTPPSTRFSSSSTFTSWPSNTKYSPSCSSLPKRLHFPASAGRGSEEYYLNYEYRILRSSLSRPTSVALMLVTVIISLRPSRKLLPEMLLLAWHVILASITSRLPVSFRSDALHTKYHPTLLSIGCSVLHNL